MSWEPETEDVVVTVVGEREVSFLLRNEKGLEAFFPKREIVFKRRNQKTGQVVVEVPVYILESRGW